MKALNTHNSSIIVNRTKHMIALLLLVTVCAACGQKGPLKLPEPVEPRDDLSSEPKKTLTNKASSS